LGEAVSESPSEIGTVTIADDPAGKRYEIAVDGAHAGYAYYARTPGEIVYEHTEVDPAFEGHGLAGRLVRFALEDSRSRGEHVIARCPYVRAFIHKHPEYAGLTHRA
jgi:predicted GNAT family acetyltransferase